MDLDEAVANFKRATTHCDNLVTVHRGHGGPRRGRRDEEVSVNRAVIVLSIASWQAVVQDFALACVDFGEPAPGNISRGTFLLLAGRIRAEVGAFATPNAENTRRLLTAAGWDPHPCWTWRQIGGRGRGIVEWTPSDAARRLNEWLKVRHAIAHGHGSLPVVNALQSVRQRGASSAEPALRLVDAEQCLAFVRRLARLTAAGVAAHLAVRPPTWTAL